MTRRETLLIAALAVIAAGSGGYAAGQATGPSSPGAVPSSSPPSASASPPMPSPAMGGTQSPSAAGYRNDALAMSIARQAGTRLADHSPEYVAAAQVQAMSEAAPAGAAVDKAAGTIAFTSLAVSLTVVAVPPGGPDMTFRVAGMADPTIVVRKGASVKVRFINADTDEAHGWEVTAERPPFPFHVGAAAFLGAFAQVLGDPTTAGDGAETISFTASAAGSYRYVCPMPGHAQMGMHGTLIVR